ncbi:MAG: HAD family hydrolase, partial [Oscillospiraceae bacterium]|nr:HAD family hydrolase [Oscillospiraceae bacterium]
MNTVLFDLDGTLLPMDQEAFIRLYFGALTQKFAPHGFEPEKLIQGLWAGMKAMQQNNGVQTNEEVFWRAFTALTGEKAADHRADFDAFYQNEFSVAKKATACHPLAARCVRLLREKGYRVALATNPLFPQAATWARIEWAGLSPSDFALITTYENSRHCKPNPDYYRKDVLEKLRVMPEDCLMVGNDVKEDLFAEARGMQVILLNETPILTDGFLLNSCEHGDFQALWEK